VKRREIHPQEKEANQFARNLLMPEKMVRAYFKTQENRRGQDAVERFAERFAVPIEQAALRLQELEIIC